MNLALLGLLACGIGTRDALHGGTLELELRPRGQETAWTWAVEGDEALLLEHAQAWWETPTHPCDADGVVFRLRHDELSSFKACGPGLWLYASLRRPLTPGAEISGEDVGLWLGGSAEPEGEPPFDFMVGDIYLIGSTVRVDADGWGGEITSDEAPLTYVGGGEETGELTLRWRVDEDLWLLADWETLP
ncbi:MAG: hypothetical protein H6740_19655 [Alphaproteobacteria bacterium]|nr:hypothetical protein [Alphaproteobacteria bacterium]